MKRLFVILLVLIMTVSCCACGSKESPSGGKEPSSGASSSGSAAPAGSSASSGKGKDTDYVIDNVYFRTYPGTDGEHFQGSYRITNTGKTLLSLSAAFWELKDSSGRSITSSAQLPGTFAYPQIISPGESSWYYINTLTERMTDGSAAVASAEPVYQIPPHSYEENYLLNLPITDLRLDESSGGITAAGTVGNPGDHFVSYVLVYVNLFDKDGHLVGQLMSDALGIDAGGKTDFTAVSDTRKTSGELALTLSSVAHFEAVAINPAQ